MSAGSGWNTSTDEPGGLEPVREHGRELALVPVALGTRTSAWRSAVSAATSTASAAARAARRQRPAAHARSTGRVRQVTPPEPFSPTSRSGTAWTSTPAASSRAG